MAKNKKKKPKKSYLYTCLYACITVIAISLIVLIVYAIQPKLAKSDKQKSADTESVAMDLTDSETSSAESSNQASKNNEDAKTTADAEETSEKKETTTLQEVLSDTTVAEIIESTTSKPTSSTSFYAGVTYRSPYAKTCDVFKHGRTLMLVNNDWELPEDFKWDLVYWTNGQPVDALSLNSQAYDSVKAVDRAAYQPLKNLFAAAKKAGVPLQLVSAYRSIDLQDRLFARSVNSYISQGYSKEEAIKKANYARTFTGTSEHNIGLGFDILEEGNYYLSTSFDQTKTFKWLQENAEDYGFILRYPKGKTDITGIMYEPWHYRYVGVDVAKEINSKGMVFEQYIAYLDGE